MALFLLPFRRVLAVQRAVALANGGALVLLSVWMLLRVRDLGIEVYRPGNWPAPFGTALVLDRLACLMLLMIHGLSLVFLTFAVVRGQDRAHPLFHALVQALLLGLSGTVLMGDVVSLFIFLQIALVSGCGLLLLANPGSPISPRALLPAAAVSTLLLVGIGLLLAATDTSSLATMAETIAATQPGAAGLMPWGAALVLVGFALVAILMPFGLARPLQSAPAPVAALCLLIGSTGLYGILRLSTVLLSPLSPLSGLPGWLLPIVLAGMAAAGFACLKQVHLSRKIALAAGMGAGLALAGILLGSETGTAAGLLAMVNTAIAGGTLCLIADLPPRCRDAGTRALYMIAAASLVGAPPFSGFFANVLLLRAAGASEFIWAVWAGVALACATGLLAFARPATAGAIPPSQPNSPPSRPGFLVAALCVTLLLALSLFAQETARYIKGTAYHLLQPLEYIDVVLGMK